jgi:hypothetical protein
MNLDRKRLTSRDKYPCYVNGKHCEERHRACQDSCPKMKAAKDENENRKATERAKKQFDRDVTEYIVIRNHAAARRKIGER